MTNNVSNIRKGVSPVNDASAPLAGGGDPPHDGGMEHRVTALETRLDTILPTLATKTDIEGVRSDINRWTLGTVLTIIGVVVAAVIGLNTLWKSAAAPQQSVAPVVIQIPAYPAQPPKANIGAFQPGDKWIPASGSTPPSVIHQEPKPSH
ncbi:MAG: hypothetical protein OJF61_001939 [Rhodanobacteraceae bacterium]|jgi:hypothetical protein|nr:MAG: hypothetical protein OJF61_001939 [Rhodanobacteraceae bacterium]